MAGCSGRLCCDEFTAESSIDGGLFASGGPAHLSKLQTCIGRGRPEHGTASRGKRKRAKDADNNIRDCNYRNVWEVVIRPNVKYEGYHAHAWEYGCLVIWVIWVMDVESKAEIMKGVDVSTVMRHDVTVPVDSQPIFIWSGSNLLLLAPRQLDRRE